MATQLDTLAGANSTAAIFRAWASFIHTLFTTTSGWVDTADTGSIDLTTVAAPTVAQQVMGYKVYGMADTLQATAPVFVKIEFGCGASAGYPQWWVTVGTAHDGAGLLTNILVPRRVLTVDVVSGTPGRCHGSGDTNRICFAMFLSYTTNAPLWFSLERTKDASGVDTAVGVLVAGGGNSGGSTFSAYCPFTGVIPPQVIGLHMLLSYLNTSSFDGNVGVGVMYPMGTEPKQPGMNVIGVRANDFTDFAGPIITIYGAAHTYVQCGPTIYSFRAGYNNGLVSLVTDAGVRLCLRYE